MSVKVKMTLWYTLLMVLILAVTLAFFFWVYRETAELEAVRRINMVLDDNIAKLSYSDGSILYDDGESGPVAGGIPAMEYGVSLQAYYYNEYGVLELMEPSAPALTDMYFRAAYERGQTVADRNGTEYYYGQRFIDVDPEGPVPDPLPPVEDASDESASGEMASGEMKGSGEPSDGRAWHDGRGRFIVLMGFLPVERVELIWVVAAVGLPLLVLLAALGGWFMAGRALAPIRKITASARDISGGEDLSRRVDIGPGKDEVHELADTFNGMLDRLETSFQAERQFTSDASHELRTPTAVILAQCDMAQKMDATPEEFRQSLGVIQRQGNKMSALIGTLLAYTRREQGIERAEMTETDISELTEAVCQEQAMVNEGRDIAMETDIRPGIAAMADMGLITSLIQNLVSNAYKYGRPGGRVWVSLGEEGGQLRLSVRDDGIGISPEDQKHVFDRFFQADRARTNADGGMGLGLAMAKQIARLHGGTITLQSEPGQGSEFVFSMPLDGKK